MSERTKRIMDAVIEASNDHPSTFSLIDSVRSELEGLDALLEELRVLWPEIRQLQDGFMNGDPNFSEWDHSVRNRCIAMSFKLNGWTQPLRIQCEACAGVPEAPICAVCGGSGYVDSEAHQPVHGSEG